MIAMTPEYLAQVMATIYRRRVREELAFARQAREWGPVALRRLPSAPGAVLAHSGGGLAAVCPAAAMRLRAARVQETAPTELAQSVCTAAASTRDNSGSHCTPQ